MIKSNNQPGYILVFSLMFIALLVMLAIRISDRGRVHVSYVKTMIDRERAKMLAFSGLQIAMTQLAIKEESKKQDQPDSKEGEKKDQKGTQSKGVGKLWTEKESKEFIKQVWPYLHRWQEFELTRGTYGTDGVIRICIGCEEGKIDINQTFDFNDDPKKRKFIGQSKTASTPDKSKADKNNFKKVFEEIFKKITKFIKGEERFKAFENYLVKKKQFEKIYKNRQNKLYDTTEFLRLKGFEGFADKVFYTPYLEKGRKIREKPTVYWTDIFTIFSGSKQISSWFISPSIKRLLGFKEKEGMKIADKIKKAENISKNFKATLKFPEDWNNFFAPIYGMKYENLPKWFTPLLNTKFEPKTFSVLSYGEVNKVSCKIFAIIERKKIRKGKKTVVEFDIKKFYCV